MNGKRKRSGEGWGVFEATVADAKGSQRMEMEKGGEKAGVGAGEPGRSLLHARRSAACLRE